MQLKQLHFFVFYDLHLSKLCGLNQKIEIQFPNEISLYIKRDDLLHPSISGNKFRKLKYNIQAAKENGYSKLLTFGGAFSNHIAAVAAVGKEYGFETVGVIRGEELEKNITANPTLYLAFQNGMKFDFVTREEYRTKDSAFFIETLRAKHGDFYLLPEGGTNDLAVKGCEEILERSDLDFTHVCCPVGTGGTISGISNSAVLHQKVLGFAALKGDFLLNDICSFAKNDNCKLVSDYHFGGYGKINESLIRFMNTFYTQTGIPLDPVYTGKMLYGIIDMIEKGNFPNKAKILAIHTGGLQGIAGMNIVLKKKQLPIIEYI